ncbi:MAG: hypothetical protein K0U98_13155 [Deltaproteobacteria bacterium]|nr:hypothetical protein [Deltaproteobacteria bacterium]
MASLGLHLLTYLAGLCFFGYIAFDRLRKYRRLLSAVEGLPQAHPNLWTAAHLLFSKATLETVFTPLLSDLEVEEKREEEQRGCRAARAVSRRGYGIFWKTVAAQLWRSTIDRFLRLGRLRRG